MLESTFMFEQYNTYLNIHTSKHLSFDEGLPSAWVNCPPVMQALNLAFQVHDGEFRELTGDGVLTCHVIPVGILAYDYALHKGLDPVEAAVIGILHDAVEKTDPMDGSEQSRIQQINNLFGDKITGQVLLLSIPKISEKAEVRKKGPELDIFVSRTWRENIKLMTAGTKGVKKADIFNNTDPRVIRPSKLEQRLDILESLYSPHDILIGAILEKMSTFYHPSLTDNPPAFTELYARITHMLQRNKIKQEYLLRAKPF